MSPLGTHCRLACALATLFWLTSGPALADVPRMVTPLGGNVAMPVVSMKDARFLATLRQQYDFSCGSAALATLLTHHYGLVVDEASVFQAMFERGNQDKIRAEGFSMLDMKYYLDSHGFDARGIEGTLDQLAQAAVPAIVLIQENGYAHFVVIKGVRDRDVLLGDPAMGTRVMPRADFERYWINNILLLVANRVELARFNRVEDWRIRPQAPLHAERGSSAIHALTRHSLVDF